MAALGLAACVAGPDFVAPAAPRPAQYTAVPLPNLESGEQRLDGALAEPEQWWTVLHSPSLDSTIGVALTANRALAAARARLSEAQELSGASEAGGYPPGELRDTARREE